MEKINTKNTEIYALNYIKYLDYDKKYFIYHKNQDNFDYTSDFYNVE